MGAVADSGREREDAVSKHQQIQPESRERRTGRPNPFRAIKFSGANENRGKNRFPC